MPQLKGSKRLEDETQDEYRKRRRSEQKKVERYLKGRLFWDSSKAGAYVRPKAADKQKASS